MEAKVRHQAHAAVLRQREQELAQREIDLLERELSLMILKQQQEDNKPVPNKRRNLMRREKNRRSKKRISGPSGKCLCSVLYVSSHGYGTRQVAQVAMKSLAHFCQRKTVL